MFLYSVPASTRITVYILDVPSLLMPVIYMNDCLYFYEFVFICEAVCKSVCIFACMFIYTLRYVYIYMYMYGEESFY